MPPRFHALIKSTLSPALIVKLRVDFVQVFPQSVELLAQTIEFFVNSGKPVIQVPAVGEP
jgi:hypothetical protein